jgi:hypothetical protein
MAGVGCINRDDMVWLVMVSRQHIVASIASAQSSLSNAFLGMV